MSETEPTVSGAKERKMSGTGSEIIKTVQETFSQTEKSLRNLHPVLFITGVFFVSKLKVAEMEGLKNGEWSDYLTFFLLVPVLFGPTVYTTYRVILELLDYALVYFMDERYDLKDRKNTEGFCSLPYRLAMHTILEFQDATFSELRNYYSYKFACCHNVMLSSILFLLLVSNSSGWGCGWIIGGFAVLVSAFLNYLVLCHRQRISYMKFNKESPSADENET